MKYDSHKISDDAISAGYPGRFGWHVVTDENGVEVAQAHPEFVGAIVDALNSLDTPPAQTP